MAEAVEQTEAARSGFLRRVEQEADPERVLPEEVRRERGVAPRRDDMRKAAAKSARGAERGRCASGSATTASRTELVSDCDVNGDDRRPTSERRLWGGQPGLVLARTSAGEHRPIPFRRHAVHLQGQPRGVGRRTPIPRDYGA